MPCRPSGAMIPTFLALFLAATLLPTPALALDGELPGLVFGAELGLGESLVSQQLQGADLASFDRLGIATGLRAGWGVSEAIALFASARTNWFRFDTQASDNVLAAQGVVGLGLIQYFRGGRSDWYSTGSLGLGFFALPQEDVDALSGIGFTAGLGRRLGQWLGAEAQIGWSNPGRSTGSGDLDAEIWSFRLVITGMAY